MDEVFDLTSCSSGFVLKSTLLHKPEVQYSLLLLKCFHLSFNAKLSAKSM